jgi:hypothetical protein
MTLPMMPGNLKPQDWPIAPGRQVGHQVLLLRRVRQELDADVAFSFRDTVGLGMEEIKKKRRNLKDLNKEIEN